MTEEFLKIDENTAEVTTKQVVTKEQITQAIENTNNDIALLQARKTKLENVFK